MGLDPKFPLFPHRNGLWARKINGQFRYLGSVAKDPKGEAALALWLKVKDYWIAGREPPADLDGLTVGELCDRFLQAKDQALAEGAITHLTRIDYGQTADRIVAQFGKNRLASDLRSEDFATFRASLSKTRGVVALGNEVNRVRVVFRFAKDHKLIAELPYGPEFKRPSRKALRRHKGQHEAKHGSKVFTAAEIRQLLDKATPQLQAMMLLGINCGFGNNDCALLPLKTVDLEGGWITFPRPKTGLPRKCALWPETIAALEVALNARRAPKDDEEHGHLFFITAARGSFAKQTTDNPISKEFAKLLKAQGMQQKGRGFYSLRHTFRTVGGGARDLEAVRAIMGHVNEHVEDAYIHSIDDERLTSVAGYVRQWLYAKPTKDKTDTAATTGGKANAEPRKIKASSRRQASAEGPPFLRVVG
jgi:Integrase